MVRFPALVQAAELVKDLDRRNIAGVIVEAGCWKGGLVAFLARHTAGQVTGIDKGDGLDEGEAEDGRVLKKYDGSVKGHLAIKESDVAPAPKNAEIIVGKYAEKVIAELPDQIRLLRVDVDMYHATGAVLEAAREKLVDGAYVVLDDFDDFEGVRRAVYEFLHKHGRYPRIRQHPYGGSFYFVWKVDKKKKV